jgi:hypothetical protein
LQPPEADLWREIVSGSVFKSAASQAILAAAMEARGRMRRCREAIDTDGMTTRDRFGQLRGHPLLASERDARAAFLAGMRHLNLDLGT